jgi:hypothetical protein
VTELGLIVDTPTGAPAIVTHVQLPITYSQLAGSRSLAVDAWEGSATASLPMGLGSMAEIVSHGTVPAGWPSGLKWHPSSRYRVLTAMTHCFGRERALKALS